MGLFSKPPPPPGPKCDCMEADKLDFDYIGPDHLVVIDPPDHLYKQYMYESAVITIAYFALGATFMPIVWFALSFSVYYYVNLHVLIFTLGFQLLMPISFLMMHRLDGAGVWMKDCEKRQQSFILRMVTFVCTIIGLWALFQWILFRGWKFFLSHFSIHTFTGLMSVILNTVDTVTLFLPFKNERSAKAIFCRFVCFLAFLFSSCAFISGLYKDSFLQWFPTKHISVYMTLFCLFYSFVVTYKPVKHFLYAILLKSKVNM